MLRQRQPREQDAGFLSFLRRCRCCACGAHPPSQAAHVRLGCLERGKRPTGLGERPSDQYAVPLCVDCHLNSPEAQHQVGEAKFWRRLGIDPFAVAERLYTEYSEHHAKRKP